MQKRIKGDQVLAKNASKGGTRIARRGEEALERSKRAEFDFRSDRKKIEIKDQKVKKFRF